MKKKPRYFSLLEVIIATSLFAVLLFSTTSLFFTYHKLSTKIASIRPKVFQRALFFEKMTEFSQTMDPSTIKTHSYDHEQSLSFVFDNGFKDDPNFSGKNHCILFKTMDGELKYTLTNSKGETLTRTLLEDIPFFSPHYEESILTLTIGNKESLESSYTFILSKQPSKGGK